MDWMEKTIEALANQNQKIISLDDWRRRYSPADEGPPPPPRPAAAARRPAGPIHIEALGSAAPATPRIAVFAA